MKVIGYTFRGSNSTIFTFVSLSVGSILKESNWLLKKPLLFFNRFILVRSGCPGKQTVLPYFFGYKTGFFPFQNNSKNLDPSYKMALDIWDCLGRIELEIS